MAILSSRFKKPKIDIILALTTFVLLAFGLIMLSSVSSVISFENFGYTNFYLYKQLAFAGGGIVVWFLAQKIDYHIYKKIALPLLIISVVLTAIVFIPGVGFSYNGATRWINIGFPFQPSEILKLALIIFWASWFEDNRKNINVFKRVFLPFCGIILFVGAMLVKQPDLGTFLVIASVSIAMYFIAGARLVFMGTILGGATLAIATLIKAAPYRMQRLLVFLDPEKDPLGMGFHVNQALIAVGSGGWWGRGFGKSGQKYTGYIPEAVGDSAFAIIAEELGFIKVMIFPIALFVVFAWRGYLIARNSPDFFGKMLAFGLTSWIIFQAILNICTMVALVPLTGVPLPFISYGGTSLIMVLLASGILLNISKGQSR
ncbi:MAG: putative lipid II flippase FtsW [Patescibacteria group bacterium]|nr:putative lipid II flippase FtsW [Patescibacteria group bacterium]